MANCIPLSLLRQTIHKLFSALYECSHSMIFTIQLNGPDFILIFFYSDLMEANGVRELIDLCDDDDGDVFVPRIFFLFRRKICTKRKSACKQFDNNYFFLLAYLHIGWMKT